MGHTFKLTRKFQPMVKRTFGALSIAFITLFLGACSPAEMKRSLDLAPAKDTITGATIRSHMIVLADDDMAGREAGTAGYDKAARYVAEQFQIAGLAPLGDAGSYFQKIDFFETRLAPDSAALSLIRNDQIVDLTFKDDFLRTGGYGETSEEVTAPLVFAGYGIQALEYNHDDFTGIDVAGKILVVLSGAPPHFDTDQRAFYSSGGGKRANASERGALGLLYIRTPADQARRPWERSFASIGRPGMRWIDETGTPHGSFPELRGSASLSPAGARKLFALAEQNLDQIFEKHTMGDTGSFDLNVSATLKRRSVQRTVSSANVVGVLRGSDPLLRHEFLVYTAHLDHLGVRPGEDGDDIHNGAYDNAAGVAAILEIAKAMAALDTPPRRSVIFAAVTGEEKGQQGSSYFIVHAPVQQDQLIADINIDMPYFGFPIADIEAFGAEHSSLYGATREAAELMGLELSPDSMPEQVRFIRSDQFSFVKTGIPALAFKAGSKSSDPDIDGDAMLQGFLKNHYHRTSDDLSLPYSPEGAERFVEAALLLGLIVTEREARPYWNAGDFFGDMFTVQDKPGMLTRMP